MTKYNQKNTFRLLIEAIEAGHIDYVKFADKSKIELTGTSGISLLRSAIQFSHEMMSALLTGNNKVNLYNSIDQKTPLQQAICSGELEIVNSLVEHGASPNFVGLKDGKYRSAPLHLAAYQRNYEIMKYLIKAGSEIDFQGNSCNETALITSCRNGYIESAKILLENGADCTLLNDDGDNAHAAALKNDHFEVASLIGQYMAKKENEDLMLAVTDVSANAEENSQQSKIRTRI